MPVPLYPDRAPSAGHSRSLIHLLVPTGQGLPGRGALHQGSTTLRPNTITAIYSFMLEVQMMPGLPVTQQNPR